MTDSRAATPNGGGQDRSRTSNGGGQDRSREEDAERALGRFVAAGLPIATLGGALVAGWVASAGSAILVLAAGVLLGAIGLLWTSLRTLSGDAPLPNEALDLSADESPVDDMGERKRRALLALKDIENERDLGRLDDADYQSVVAEYREEAKAILREIDEHIGPARAEAEALARQYLATRRRTTEPASARAVSAQAEEVSERIGAGDRMVCTSCGASNERDAAFCKRCGAAMKGSPELRDAAT